MVGILGAFMEWQLFLFQTNEENILHTSTFSLEFFSLPSAARFFGFLDGHGRNDAFVEFTAKRVELLNKPAAEFQSSRRENLAWSKPRRSPPKPLRGSEPP